MHKFRWLSVPADWSVAPIGSIADESSEINRDGDAFDVLSCSKHDGFVRSLEYFKKQVFSSDLSGYKIIRRGEFGFPSNHVEEGSIGLQNLVDEGLVSPIYTVFRFHADRVDNDYAYAVLKTDLYRHIFQVSTSASVDRRGSLRWSDFSMLPFPLPPIDEQRAIHKVLAAGLAEIDQQQTERDVLAKQKRGLMQKLLTGEWRVKIDKEPAHG
jgi:type I restriction enzyme S subunit